MSRRFHAPVEFKMKNLFQKWPRKSRMGHSPLMEDNNNEDAPDRHLFNLDNPSTIYPRTQNQSRVQSSVQSRVQSSSQSLDRQSLCEVLRVSPDVVHTDSGLDSEEDQIEALIQESARTHLPQPPSELETELQRHLQAVQSVVLQELLRLKPLFELHGLMGTLIQNYHRVLFKHMKDLLLKTCSRRTCLQLLRWTLTKYLSQELFLHRDLQSSDPMQHMDLVLLTDWTQQAQDKLLDHEQAEVSSQLNHILTEEKKHSPCGSEEDYVRTYVDVIQCISATPSAAQTFSSSLSLKLSERCLQLLLHFTHSYKTHWFESLSKKKWSEPEVVTFYKILKTCKEIKKYIQTKYDEEHLSAVKDIVSSFGEIETFTLKFLLKVLSDFTENALKKYFRSGSTSRSLVTELEELFAVEPWLCLKEHEGALSQSYRLTVSLYTKHLTGIRLHALRRRWSQRVDAAVAEDAQLIHHFFQTRCPAVEKWTLLDHISELLETSDLSVRTLTLAEIQKETSEKRCVELMPQMKLLLLWIGLSRSETKAVLFSVQDQDPDQVRPNACCMGCY